MNNVPNHRVARSWSRFGPVRKISSAVIREVSLENELGSVETKSVIMTDELTCR